MLRHRRLLRPHFTRPGRVVESAPAAPIVRNRVLLDPLSAPMAGMGGELMPAPPFGNVEKETGEGTSSILGMGPQFQGQW